MLEKIIPAGSMRPIKRILGAVIGIIGIAYLLASYNIMILKEIPNLIRNYEIVWSIVLVIAGYLLYIAGRRA